MAYCSNCGAQIDDNATFCGSCGSARNAQNTQSVQNPQNFQNPYPQQQNVEDSGSFGWAVLGFFIPLVGLILFLVWKQTKPKCAKKAGIGALVSVIIGVVFNILVVILGAVASTMTSYAYGISLFL